MNFNYLEHFLNSPVCENNIPLFGCSVHIKGREVFRAGNDLEGGDFFRFYSATKPFTGLAAMQLIERGLLRLDDAVSRYLPAFRNLTYAKDGRIVPCETELKVSHLLSMSSGIDYEDEFDGMRQLLCGRELVESGEALSLLAGRPLAFEPGTHYMYGLSLDIVGAIIENISGQRLDRYMEENIFRPLGAEDLTFYPTPRQMERMSPQVSAQGIERDAYSNMFLHARHFPSGGCGLCGTVNDYMLFLDALADNGVTKSGAQLLSRDTMELFGTPILPPSAQAELMEVLKDEHQALGVRIRPTPPLKGMYTADGAAGAYALAHRDSGVTMFFTSHLLDYQPFIGTVHPQLFEALAADLSAGGII